MVLFFHHHKNIWIISESLFFSQKLQSWLQVSDFCTAAFCLLLSTSCSRMITYHRIWHQIVIVPLGATVALTKHGDNSILYLFHAQQSKRQTNTITSLPVVFSYFQSILLYYLTFSFIFMSSHDSNSLKHTNGWSLSTCL